MKRFFVLLWGIALFFSSPAWSNELPSAPLSKEEVNSLIHINQLSEWVGGPVEIAAGLCVQLNYQGSWPAGGLNSLSGHAESLFRQTWEACNTARPDMRWVAQMREILQSQIPRLKQWNAEVSRCQGRPGGIPAVEKCLATALGRPLNDEEKKLLQQSLQSP